MPLPDATPGGHSVRAATLGDVAAVADIERASFGDPWPADAFRNLLTNPAVWFVVLERGGASVRPTVQGYLVAWFAADEAEVANLAIAPGARGQRLGARLLDAALAEAARRGTSTVYLEVRESNEAARRLYASRGFTAVGRRRRYYRNPSEDALVMARVLGPGAYAAAPPGRNESGQRA